MAATLNTNATDYQLFHRTWAVRTLEIYCYSEEELRVCGVPWTGSASMNRAMMNTPRDIGLPIPNIAELRANGAPVSLLNQADAVPMYKLITEHITNWFWIMNNKPWAPLPPAEDLLLLESLGKALKPLKDMVDGSKPMVPDYFRRMMALPGVNRTLFHPERDDPIRQAAAAKVAATAARASKERSMAEIMARRQAGYRGDS